MAWQFEEWRVFKWMGGNAIRLLVVAGSIGAGALVWWLRPAGHHYFTMRDAAEISGAIIERQMALIDDLSYYYNPYPAPGWGGIPKSWFASTNGNFWTNSLARYPMRDYFLQVEKDIARIYCLTGKPYSSFWNLITPYRPGYGRAWIDLSGAGNSHFLAYNGQPLWDVAGMGSNGADYPYAMNRDWYMTNIHDHADGRWLPWIAAVDTNSTAHQYVQTGTVHTISRALSACRWTVEIPGQEYIFVSGKSGMVGPGATRQIYLLWSAEAYGTYNDSYYDLLQQAVATMAASVPTTHYSVPESIAEMTNALDYASILQHQAGITLGDDDIHEERRVYISEFVVGILDGTVVNGTNNTGYCTAGFDVIDGADFFHTDYGNTVPGMLVGGLCTRWQSYGWDGNKVDNAYVLMNSLLKWEGLYSEPVFQSFRPADPEPGSYTYGNFGWRYIPTNCAIMIDWEFDHLNDREAFW